MRRSFAFLPLVLILIVPLLVCTGARAANIELQNYRRAFALIDEGHADQAMVFATHGRDPILNKVIRSYYLAAPGNDGSFDEIANFIAANPDWPGLRALRASAEQKIPDNAPSEQINDWFAKYPPVTMVGVYRYIDALNMAGRAQDSADYIRRRWTEGEFTPDEMTAYATRFGAILDTDSHWARLDHLLWKNDVADARRMYPFVTEDMKMVAEARLALANQSPNASDLAARVASSNWQDDTGFLYELVRYDIRNNYDDQALALLQRAPDNSAHPELWWGQRQMMVRRLMERRDFDSAYRLIVGHGHVEGKDRLQAEFMAGWLALRFLSEPGEARNHFQTLLDAAQTPISRARGAYWLGRACEAVGDTEAAQTAYEEAATLDTTYYGQLAAAHIYEDPSVEAKAEPAMPAAVRTAFYKKELVRATERLHAIGAKDYAQLFFRAAVEEADDRSDFVLLTEFAQKIARPDLAIEAAKTANQKNIVMTAGGYPIPSSHLPKPPEAAFTLAVIRQESMFNPNAESSAGAKGLMQLMPGTAKSVAKKMGVPYKEQKLCDISYGLRLGTCYIEGQIDAFDGSYVLALAAYNAGAHRVREWIEQNGDPRQSNVDAVDWIEEIPIEETRNYVQRILENLQIYRARLKGGEAPLLILKDLKR